MLINENRKDRGITKGYIFEFCLLLIDYLFKISGLKSTFYPALCDPNQGSHAMAIKSLSIFLLLVAPSLFASEPEWIPLSSDIPVASNIQLIHSSPTAVSLRLSLKGFWLDTFSTPQGAACSLRADNAFPIHINDCPELITFTSSIIISSHGEMTITIENTGYTEYHNIIIRSRSEKSSRNSNEVDRFTTLLPSYEKDEFLPRSLAYLSDPYLIRNVRGQDVNIMPFQYDPVTKVLRVYDDIIVHLQCHGSSGLNTVEGIVAQGSEREFSAICSRHFINFTEESNTRDGDDQPATNMLIISYGDFIEALQPFIEWKIKKGIATDVVDIADIGDAQHVKSYVKKYYDEHGLTYLLLVGDKEYVPSVVTDAGLSDNSYGYVSGNDHYPDVFVGRLPAATAGQVSLQVKRILRYEQCLFTDNDWLTRTTGIASSLGPGDDGEYDYEHVRALQTDLKKAFGVEPVELFDGDQGGVDHQGNPTAAMVKEAVEKGTCMIIYTGLGDHDSWFTTQYRSADVSLLSNYDRYPIILSAGCQGGDFGQPECLAQAWLRASRNGQPTGAVAVLMPSGSLGWSPPMHAQDEMIRILTDSRDQENNPTFGAVSMEGCMAMNSKYGPGAYAMTDIWTVFGDPSMMVMTSPPAEMQVTTPQVVATDASGINIHCDAENATVALTSGRHIVGTGGVKNGNATVRFIDQPDPGTLTVTVTSFNHKPFITAIPVINYPYHLQCKVPEDYQQMVFPVTLLQWNKGTGGKPVYYKIYLGTDNPPSNVVNGNITNDTTYTPSQDLAYDQDYFWRVDAYNDYGHSTGDIWHFRTIRPPDENFEADFPRDQWYLQGAQPWYIDNTISFRGSRSCRSGMIKDNESSSLIYHSDNTTDDFVSFWVRVSSEAGHDKLQFLIDGFMKEEWSGEIEWSHHISAVAPGIHLLEWRYTKDTGEYEGIDGAWLDDLYLPGNGGLEIDAGPDEEICMEEAHPLSGNARNFTSVKWSTTGNGYFDNPANLNPVYFPNVNDYNGQKIIVTLTGYNQYTSTNVKSAKTLSFTALPTTMENFHDTIIHNCNSNKFELYDVYSPDIASYLWMPSGETFSDYYFDPQTYHTGTHCITLEVTTTSGCHFIKQACITFSDNSDKLSGHGLRLLIYPNPCHGMFTAVIRSGQTDQVDLHIYNIMGKPVYQHDRLKVTHYYSGQIDLSHLPKGIYFVEIKENDESYRQKLVIQ
jgi:hypothetical protein